MKLVKISAENAVDNVLVLVTTMEAMKPAKLLEEYGSYINSPYGPIGELEIVEIVDADDVDAEILERLFDVGRAFVG